MNLMVFYAPQRNLSRQKIFTVIELFEEVTILDMNFDDRKRIFLELLPEEEFIDRRIETSEMIEPESDSEDDNIKFIDEYDKHGKRLNKKKQILRTMIDFNKTKSYTSGFRSQKIRATDGFEP